MKPQGNAHRMSSKPLPHTILLAGASRGLGLGLAGEFLGRGWNVIATVRSPAKAVDLQQLKLAHPGMLAIETLDIADAASIQGLSKAMNGRVIDMLFVVAGMSAQGRTPIQDMPASQIGLEFVTNATAPIALAETLLGQIAPGGTIALMTSILGSLASNAGGGLDVYRASKAALNMMAVNFSLRHKDRPVRLIHPGWVRTDMGGKDAPVDVPTSARGMADVITGDTKPGLAYLDYQGQTLPW
jgi:NAD(P)-dependent dehydrogenase (short-subunit alcohol dehydrogenase family)